MAWLRLDDGFAQHPKIIGLSDRDYRAWMTILLYCARYRTEGDVPENAFISLGISRKSQQNFIEKGLLDVDENGIKSVHDWAEFNPPDPTNAARQERWRNRQKAAKRNAERNAKRNGLTVTSSVTDNGVTRNGPSRALARAHKPVPSTSLLSWKVYLGVVERLVANYAAERELALEDLDFAIGQ